MCHTTNQPSWSDMTESSTERKKEEIYQDLKIKEINFLKNLHY